jgi:F-type H+-transporting ATPase subunit b
VAAAWLFAAVLALPSFAAAPYAERQAPAGVERAGEAPPPAHQGGPAVAEQPAGHAAPGAHEGGEGEAAPEPLWKSFARLFNFALLAGALVYLLRSPLAAYLHNRGQAIRGELAKAADMRAEAAAEMARIEARLEGLPGEIEKLRRRGADEITAEEARIRDLAAAERQRMLDQARREIESQLRIAERDLKARAAELAVAVATERVRRTMTDADQARLVDRYLAQVGR